MKLYVDARYLGLSGIGSFLKGVLENIDTTKFNLFLIGKKERLDKLNIKFNPVYDESSPFSSHSLLKPSFAKEVNKNADAFFTPFYIVPFFINVPIFSCIHDVAQLDIKSLSSSFLDRNIKKFLIKRSLKKSRKVFTVSSFSLSRICFYFPKYKNKLVVVPNGIKKEFYELKETIKGSKDFNKLLYVGNLKPHKGLDILASAFLKLPNNYKLYIAGDKSSLRVSSSSLDILSSNDRVVFLGNLEDEEVAKEISSSACLILPSRYEGFGMPPLEALFFNTEVIISDIPVFKELYDGVKGVHFFKDGDAVSLTNQIKDLKRIDFHADEALFKKFNYSKTSSIIEENIKEEL